MCTIYRNAVLDRRDGAFVVSVFSSTAPVLRVGGERVRLVLSPPTGVFNVNHRIRAVSPERCEKIWFRFDGHRQRARMTRLLPVALQHSYSDWQTRPSAILMLQAELVGNGNLAI